MYKHSFLCAHVHVPRVGSGNSRVLIRVCFCLTSIESPIAFFCRDLCYPLLGLTGYSLVSGTPSCSDAQWLEQCPAGASGEYISTVMRKFCCGNNSAVHAEVEPRVLGDKLQAKNYRTDGPGRVSMSHLGTAVELGATSYQAQKHLLECSTILEPSDLHLMIVTYF